MNAPSLNDLRNAIPARDLTDEKMNQVRDLLVGDLMRANDARMALLEEWQWRLHSAVAGRIEQDGSDASHVFTALAHIR